MVKQTWRQKWDALPFHKKNGTLTGLIALGATMVTVSATSRIPVFWADTLAAAWGILTVLAISWQVLLQLRYRHSHK
ncbi:MAG: hypothetical protein M0Z53_09055 [Thermaerobacter sp.]|nr:hypothetical protein [Thermaerobacter sp.]